MMLVQLSEDEFYEDAGPRMDRSMKVSSQAAIWTRAGTHDKHTNISLLALIIIIIIIITIIIIIIIIIIIMIMMMMMMIIIIIMIIMVIIIMITIIVIKKTALLGTAKILTKVLSL